MGDCGVQGGFWWGIMKVRGGMLGLLGIEIYLCVGWGASFSE